MKQLLHLIDETRAAAQPEPPWIMEGGRSCPLGWEDCSQPVFRLAGSDHYDYGYPGGPGYASCQSSCPHEMKEPPIVCVHCYQDGHCGTGGPCSEWGWLATEISGAKKKPGA